MIGANIAEALLILNRRKKRCSMRRGRGGCNLFTASGTMKSRAPSHRHQQIKGVTL